VVGSCLGFNPTSFGHPDTGRPRYVPKPDADGHMVVGMWMGYHYPYPPSEPRLPTNLGLQDLFVLGMTSPFLDSTDREEMWKRFDLPYRPEVMVNFGANLVMSIANKEAVAASLAKYKFMVSFDLFLTETAKQADVVLPAASTYEKDGTLTNSAGEVQMTHRSIDPQGPRSDFDLLRILSFQLSQLGMGPAIRFRTPEAAFEEIRQHVPGYGVSFSNLLAGGAEQSVASAKAVENSYEAPAGTVFSSHDYLFSSGTLGRYCSRLNSCNEAEEKPWSSSPNIQSWWYR
jgi:anaerobic selenocysteine-containing dehydrogenase